jgi:hypothetical protein
MVLTSEEYRKHAYELFAFIDIEIENRPLLGHSSQTREQIGAERPLARRGAEGRPFGRQSVVVTAQDGGLDVRTDAALRASLGPLTLFSYTQDCTVTWRGGALTGLRCETRQNGRTKSVEGDLAAGMLRMRGITGSVAFSPATLPTSWWTRPPLSTREMINTETGARLPVRVALIGREIIVANGERMQADHIRVIGTLSVDLWYDAQGHWVSCAFVAQGQHMTYRLMTPPSAGPS